MARNWHILVHFGEEFEHFGENLYTLARRDWFQQGKIQKFSSLGSSQWGFLTPYVNYGKLADSLVYLNQGFVFFILIHFFLFQGLGAHCKLLLKALSSGHADSKGLVSSQQIKPQDEPIFLKNFWFSLNIKKLLWLFHTRISLLLWWTVSLTRNLT